MAPGQGHEGSTVYKVYGNRGSEALRTLGSWRGGTAISDFYLTYSVLKRLVKEVRQQRSIPHSLRLVDNALEEVGSPEAKEIA